MKDISLSHRFRTQSWSFSVSDPERDPGNTVLLWYLLRYRTRPRRDGDKLRCAAFIKHVLDRTRLLSIRLQNVFH